MPASSVTKILLFLVALRHYHELDQHYPVPACFVRKCPVTCSPDSLRIKPIVEGICTNRSFPMEFPKTKIEFWRDQQLVKGVDAFLESFLCILSYHIELGFCSSTLLYWTTSFHTFCLVLCLQSLIPWTRLCHNQNLSLTWAPTYLLSTKRRMTLLEMAQLPYQLPLYLHLAELP